MQTSRGRTASLHRTPAGFTALALDGYGLRDLMLTRPANSASYPVPVRRVATLLHASFRPRLATTPLRFANPSPPSGWVEDFHLQADVHARHTLKKTRLLSGAGLRVVQSIRITCSRRWCHGPGCLSHRRANFCSHHTLIGGRASKRGGCSIHAPYMPLCSKFSG